MTIENDIRPGLAGYWDRFVGPRASRVESAGTLAAVAAAARWGDVGLAPGRGTRRGRALLRLAAIDLWGGAWVNNTPACVRWYERRGQGPREHLGFAALHVLHPALIGWLDSADGRRSRRSATTWTLGHYAWMLGSAAVITNTPARRRLTTAAAATAAGLCLDRLLGPSPAAPWFAPVYYTKLLIGHAAGSVWDPAADAPRDDTGGHQ
ncbi:MAG: hypothetical protein L0H84_06545 [Pseudonocardia sp.]|nr:hypothetical protein [Pseudonocardia sp.]